MWMTGWENSEQSDLFLRFHWKVNSGEHEKWEEVYDRTHEKTRFSVRCQNENFTDSYKYSYSSLSLLNFSFWKILSITRRFTPFTLNFSVFFERSWPGKGELDTWGSFSGHLSCLFDWGKKKKSSSNIGRHNQEVHSEKKEESIFTHSSTSVITTSGDIHPNN